MRPQRFFREKYLYGQAAAFILALRLPKSDKNLAHFR